MRKISAALLVWLIAATGPYWMSARMARTAAAGTVDRIVAVVNDEAITQGELAIWLRMERGMGEEEPTTQQWDIALRNAIDNRLLSQEAKANRVEIKESDVEAELKRIRERLKFDLRVQRRLVRDRLLRTKMLSRAVGMEVQVTPGEIQEYYRRHAAELRVGAQVRLSVIFISRDAHVEPGALEARLKTVLAELKKKSFAEVAKAYSEGARTKAGGDLGWKEPGVLAPFLETVAFRLKKGETGEPIRSADGYYLLQVTDRKSGTPMARRQAQRKIRNLLGSKRYQEKVTDYLLSLRRKALIWIPKGEM